MKISLFVPKDKDLTGFINKELDSAQNIKDKQTKKSVITGLKKIDSVLTDGHFYLWNGEELFHSEYNGEDFYYYCGREFEIPKVVSENKYLMITMDTKECMIAELNGKKITKLWHEKSNVPGKSKPGGQSAQRYDRIREEAKKQWFKKISSKLEELAG